MQPPIGLLLTALLLTTWGCAPAQGPMSPLGQINPPLEHSQRVVVLDQAVRDTLLLVNAVHKRLPGGQLLVQAGFRNRLTRDNVWAQVRFRFLDPYDMPVDESEWVDTLFAPGEVTTVQGSSMSPHAVKHVLLLRNLRSATGRLGPAEAIYEIF